MPTFKELKKMAAQRKIKGRVKMNKSQLEAALGIVTRKSANKKVRKSRTRKIRKSDRRKQPRKIRPRKSRTRKIKKSRSAGKKASSAGKKAIPSVRTLTLADLDADLKVSDSKKTKLPNLKMTKAQADMSEIIWNSEKADSLDNIKESIRATFKKKFGGNMKGQRASRARILAKKLFEVFDNTNLEMIQDWLETYKGQLEEGSEGIKRVPLSGKSNKGVKGDFTGALEELKQSVTEFDEENLATAVLELYPFIHTSDFASRLETRVNFLIAETQNDVKIKLLEALSKLDKSSQIKIIEELNKRDGKYWDMIDELVTAVKKSKRVSAASKLDDDDISKPKKEKRSTKKLIDLVPEFKELERLQNRVELKIVPERRLDAFKDRLEKILRNVGVNFDEFREVVKNPEFLAIIADVHGLNEELKKVQTSSGARFISAELTARKDNVVKALKRLGIDDGLFVRRNGRKPNLEVFKHERPIDDANPRRGTRTHYSVLIEDPIPAVILEPRQKYRPKTYGDGYVDVFKHVVLKPEQSFLLNLPLRGLEEKQEQRLEDLMNVIKGILLDLFENALIHKGDIASQIFLEKDLEHFVNGLLTLVYQNSETLGQYLKQVADLTIFLRPSLDDDSDNYFRLSELLGRTPHEAGEILRSKIIHKRIEPIHFLNLSTRERFPLLDNFTQDDESLKRKIFDANMGKIIQETEREKNLLVNALIRQLDPTAKSARVPVVLGMSKSDRKRLEENLQLTWHDSCQDIDEQNKVLYMEEVIVDDGPPVVSRPMIFCFDILQLHENNTTVNPHTGVLFDEGFMKNVKDLDAELFKAKKLALQSKSVVKKAVPKDPQLDIAGNMRINMRGLSDTMDSTWAAHGLYRAFNIFEPDVLPEVDQTETDDEDEEDIDLGLQFSMDKGEVCHVCKQHSPNSVIMFCDNKGPVSVCTAEKCICSLNLGS